MAEPYSPDQIRPSERHDGDHDDKDYSAESAYAYTKDRSENLLAAASKNTGLFYGILATILFVVIALVVFLPMLMKSSGSQGNKDLEARLKALENRMGDLETKVVTTGQVSHQDERIDQLANRINNMELAIAQKMDQLSRDIGEARKGGNAKTEAAPARHEPPAAKSAAAEKQAARPAPSAPEKTAAQPSVKPVAQPPAAPAAKTAESAAGKAEYHTVQPGETVFRISKQYGISQDELRKLNNLGPNDPIKIGQKLRVKP
ncbi:LysM peptidoglycan-binding domain-containing protein [Desulfatirhabdium butyrativorans]|uniref:LysM peptidoglycan-binding domain-containing protein n=1 Tax=Desulfatirhabdium butyrativorans TaxID=340467 RepID=UPI000421AC52|nr:LysM peptidoglycan-binding domain-containing protein [Desulfatirhabdium butyrativorans]